jgi:hypothetical protein
VALSGVMLHCLLAGRGGEAARWRGDGFGCSSSLAGRGGEGGTANASSSSSGSVSPRCSKWHAAASSPPGRAASMVEVVSVVVCKCLAPGATGSFSPAICGGLLRLLDWT